MRPITEKGWRLEISMIFIFYLGFYHLVFALQLSVNTTLWSKGKVVSFVTD